MTKKLFDFFNRIFSLNEENTSSQRNDTNFLRAISICLIINSHMEDFYPIKLLATGGMIGNSIFFMLSSLGLFLSWQKKSINDFKTWYGHRITRIYPSVWAIVILITFPIDLYFGSLNTNSFLYEMGKFFFPPFWFLQALLIYYIFIFFTLRNYSYKSLIITTIPVLLFYGTYYVVKLDLTTFSIESSFFRIIFYLLIVLWGLYLGSIKENIIFNGAKDILFLFLCVGVIYAHKFLMYRGVLFQFQFIQHLAMFPLLYYALKIANSNFIINIIMNNSFLGKPIKFISKITLELFMVNNSIDIVISRMKYDFPLNSIIFIVTNIFLALFVYTCSQHISKIFKIETN